MLAGKSRAIARGVNSTLLRATLSSSSTTSVAPPATASPVNPKARASATSKPLKIKAAEKKPSGETVQSILGSLTYGPAPEDASYANAWLDKNGRKFGMYINGEWRLPENAEYAPTYNPSTGELLAVHAGATNKDVDDAVDAARAAFPAWAALDPHERAKFLYAIARQLQKHQRLFAVLESMDNGKPVRESRDADVPLAVRHFYHHAGWAQTMEESFPGYKPVGVCGQIIPWNFPLLMLAWKIAPALASGCTTVLKPAPWTRLSAWLFADVCREVGLPPGVVNIVSGDNDMAAHLAGHDGIDKLAFTGSTPVGKHLRRQVAGKGVKVSLELGGKNPVIVYETADLDAVVEGVVDMIFFNQGQVCCAGSRLLVQESIAETLAARIKTRMSRLRVGPPLDKAHDMGPLVDPAQLARVRGMVEDARKEGATIYQTPLAPDLAIVDGDSYVEGSGKGCFFPPTLITDVQSASSIVQNEVFGPVLVMQTFRTPEEAVKLANNTEFGLSAGVWTENLGLATETAVGLQAGVVWCNQHNAFDAAAGFGGYKQSGIGREGGKEGMYQYLKPAWAPSRKGANANIPLDPKWGSANKLPSPGVTGAASAFAKASGGKKKDNIASQPIDRTPKMYIGGAQKRPDGNYTLPIFDKSQKVQVGAVGAGNRKDVRDAVEAAHKAKAGWGARAAHDRSQILYYIAENLSYRREEFASRIAAMTNRTKEDAVKEVDAAISRLFTNASYADKYGGSVQETTLKGVTMSLHEPVGVVGIACPDEAPLLALVSLIAPAIVRGNTVVVIPSEQHPLCATDLYQVLDTSDLPGGVINFVTGETDTLTKTLAQHNDVDALWYWKDCAVGSKHVEHYAAENMKRTWVSYGERRDWYDSSKSAGLEFLQMSSEIKNVWIPMGH